jgi:hypothetical protein
MANSKVGSLSRFCLSQVKGSVYITSLPLEQTSLNRDRGRCFTRAMMCLTGNFVLLNAHTLFLNQAR